MKGLAVAAVWHQDKLLPPHRSLLGDIPSPPAISLCQKVSRGSAAPRGGLGQPSAPAAENQGHKQ